MLTILCPSNFSDNSENAVRYADEIAQRMNSHVILFHSIAEPATALVFNEEVHAATEVEVMQDKKQLAKLKQIKTSLESTEWGIPVSYETKVGYGETHKAIAHSAQVEKADLVVVGATHICERAENAAQPLADLIAQRTACPVLTIPKNGTFKPIRRMVIATDLRGFCPSDMNFVLRLANYFGTQVHLLHVLTTEDETTRQFSMEELERLRKRISYSRISLHVELHASLEEGIHQFCRTHRADMLVMGAHSPQSGETPPVRPKRKAYFSTLPLLLIHAKRIQL